MTFSITSRCSREGLLGGAVTSSSFAVASRCLAIRPRVGVVCSQSLTDPTLRASVLDSFAEGFGGRQSLDALAARDSSDRLRYRQIVAAPMHGDPAFRSGDRVLGVSAGATGDDAAAAGNILADPGVADAMIATWNRRDGGRSHGAVASFALSLVDSMDAGLAAGGEVRELRSAGIVVAGPADWPLIDIRVDWHPEPLSELRSLLELWIPQFEDYTDKVLDPRRWYESWPGTIVED